MQLIIAEKSSVAQSIAALPGAERRKKRLIATQDGINLITVLPEVIKSPKLTAEWEAQLTQIAKGTLAPDDFMRGIETLTADIKLIALRAVFLFAYLTHYVFLCII